MHGCEQRIRRKLHIGIDAETLDGGAGRRGDPSQNPLDKSAQGKGNYTPSPVCETKPVHGQINNLTPYPAIERDFLCLNPRR